MENKELLDKIIIGRVEPYIYAFSTNTVPNYLKIGDTYRPVFVRLNEWKKYFPDLKEEYKEKAMIDSNVFFRDYAVHKYVENELGKARLKENILPKEVYYSNEFFENATDSDVKAAINDIKESYEKNDNKYQFYDAKTSLPEISQFKREDKEWESRPNQKEAIDNFINAREKGRKNLLMYAVMRFGKSFTSMMCAKEMEAKLVVIVSAKADVKLEWKKTVEIPKNFEGYSFVSSNELVRNNNEISDRLSKGEKVAVFLTLQDLQGNLIKEKHEDIFRNKIDLLIVDETHFGARAEKYGKILENTKYEKDVKDKYQKEEDTIDDLDENLKILNVDMTLHLSGTPYRILMGSEFEKEDIISFCQFSDIVEEQEKWNSNNILGDDVKEWDNPYFGFPQMVRFAFNPSKKAKEKLKEYQKNGYTYAFSALLKPQSIKKSNDGSHKKFINEQEILELLEVIDGSKEDENVLGFLNYDKIKQGKMCRHIVCVLPYCASCDALEELIKSNKEKFKNLNDYRIINISGVENSNEYKTIEKIKDTIKECEDNNIKTLTLTVNRMLTGSTVEQWDTMIYLKDTSSPQEYDQAIFRLQNQYIKKYVDKDNKIIKYNMKPQTLLVDFDPYRMFNLQEQKSKIYNVNIEEFGNSLLEERLKNELRVSPIITMNKSKIAEIEPKNIMDAVSEYSKEKGVMDEVNDIPVDLKLLNNEEIKNIIEKQAELGSSKGLSVDNTEDDNGDELDIPIPDAKDNNNSQNYDEPNDNEEDRNNKEEPVNYEKKIRTYFARILFYAFLTNDNVISLLQVVNSIDNNDNNKRIAKNLGLNNKILKIMNNNMDAFKLSQLDYKIQHINSASHDESISHIERAEIAINKFNKISSSEYITSRNACDDIIKMIKVDDFEKMVKSNGKILDISSKMGEFTLAIWKYITNHHVVSKSELFNTFYSIPTSSIAYEFTRKIYECLNLNIENIASKFNAYDMLNVVDENNDVDIKKVKMFILQDKKFCDIELVENLFYVEGEDNMKFDVVVGNPPYQISDGGAQASAKPIYQHFVRLSNELTNKYSSLIIPSRWFVGGKGLDDFRKEMLDDNHIKELHDCLTPEDIFPNTNIRGGVCYFLRDYNYSNVNELVKVVTHENEEITFETERPMRVNNSEVFIRDGRAKNIINKIVNEKFTSISQNISSRKPFGLDGNFARGSKYHKEKDNIKNYCICYSKGLNIGYVDTNEVIVHKEWIDKWKVFIPRANNIGTELNDDNLNSFIGKPKYICTESYLVVGANLNLNQLSALNLEKYMKTKFLRYLHGLLKGSQDATSKTFELVPLQDFSENSDIDWTKTFHEIDLQLYKKYNLTEDEINYIEGKIKEM